MPEFDTRLGQLAIARGLVSLADLLSAVEESGRTGRDTADVLVARGKLSHADLESLHARLQETDGEQLQAEMERGQTLVFDELYQSLASDAAPDALIGTEHDIPATIEFDITDLGLANEDRYEVRDELGRGGMGRVYLAADRILQRKVALKTLVEEAQNDKGRERLMLEARVTGLLEHPSIVPVYDLRATRKGEPFYTMRVVQEKSLGDLIREMRRGEQQHSLTFLVTILRQVSLAIEFAHGIGVVHRDIKPENILVGKYGEVYVIDWGVAKIVSADIGLEQTGRMMMGQLVGTPAYMAPEQARGDNDAVDERSDVYALGALLYEALTLTSMFDADHVLAVLFQVVHDPPERPRERAPDRNIPAELEEICLRALEKDPRKRYPSAQAFADELELFLEGVKERERRYEMAEDALLEATQVRAVYEEVRGQYARTVTELALERENVESWASPDEKKRLWELEQQAEDLEVEIERRFGEVLRIYGQALVHVPELATARRALADLYWERFRAAEVSGQLAQAAYFEGLVRQYSDGVYDELLEGTSTLDLTTFPPGAHATVYRFQQVERRLVEWRMADVGPTPVKQLSLPHGSYVLEVSAPGFASVNVPALADRGVHQHLQVRLHPEEQVPPDFLVVPAGEFITGKITAGGEIKRAYVGDFAIARYPVTVAQYTEFLNGLRDAGDERAALEHAPSDGDALYVQRDEEGRFVVPTSDAEGDAWDPDWPIILVNYFDACAYAEWKAQRDGRPYRLPTIEEWEKAARGVDGRVYSWGNHFDASFCAMRGSRRGRSKPERVGVFAIDRSPYGAMDMCGNVAEWTSSPESGSDSAHYLGGASYNSFAEMCRLDWLLSSPRVYKFGHYGFRLAMSLPKR